jgi:hypothetical protein
MSSFNPSSLEKQAFDKFGAAVGEFNSGQLSGMTSSASNTISSGFNSGVGALGAQTTNSYAAQIADGKFGFDPKNKFLFRVTIYFDQKAIEHAAALGVDVNNELTRNLTFIIKSIDLPKYKFEYDEYNYYNFATKMLKRVTHDTISFKMYDDIANTAVKFFRIYLGILQPVTRRVWDGGVSLEGNGFAFERDMSGVDTSQRAPVGIYGEAKNILSKLVIDQYYLDRTNKNGPASNAIKINRYTFTNPRLESFDIDDQDFDDGSSANLVSCTFDYDALNIEESIIASNDELADDYPELEIMRDRSPTNNMSNMMGGLGNNQFSNLISNQLGGNDLRNLANQKMSMVSGLLGNNPLVNSQGLSGINSMKTLSIGSNGIASGISLPSMPAVADSSIGGKLLSQIKSKFP